jgi:hypothetical protein
MKHNAIIAIVFVVGCATGGVAAQLVVPPVRAGTSPTRWEYKCVKVDDPDEESVSTLNKLGAEGWEITTMTHSGHGVYMFCTKRALP